MTRSRRCPHNALAALGTRRLGLALLVIAQAPYLSQAAISVVRRESPFTASSLGRFVHSVLGELSFSDEASSTTSEMTRELPEANGQGVAEWAYGALPRIPVVDPSGTVKPLDFVLSHGLVPTHGLWLEFGVFQGASINTIASHAPHGKTVYGFDSFVGLPEDFFVRQEESIDHDVFNLGGRKPIVQPQVSLVKGWFNESLPAFLANHPGESVSLLHIDSDLYSSSKFVLDALADRLLPGTIIVFDELVNYPAYQDQELRSLYEFLGADRALVKRRAEWIGSKCPVHETPSDDPADWGPCCAVALRLIS